MEKTDIKLSTFSFIFLTFAFCLFTLNLSVQTPVFKVKSFTHEANSLLARMNKNLRTDDND